jgi:hypothetical protein
MESKVWFCNAFTVIAREPHLLIRQAELVEMRRTHAPSRERRGDRFDQMAELVDLIDHELRSFCLEPPSENVCIEKIPARGRADACSGLTARLDKTFGGEHTESLA